MSFVFLGAYQMEPYSKVAAMRGSKRKCFLHSWRGYDIWGVPRGCSDYRCSLRRRTPCSPLPFNYRVGGGGRGVPQTSWIILTGEGPATHHCPVGVVSRHSERSFWLGNELIWKPHQMRLWLLLHRVTHLCRREYNDTVTTGWAERCQRSPQRTEGTAG